MSGFDPSWLALREPHDHAVRDRSLTEAFVAALGNAPELIDLGCGTGSNLRFLAPHLAAGQRWLCIDYDPVLLQRLDASEPPGVTLATRRMDLQRELEDLPIRPGMGITSAALLDLTSAAWLERLAGCCEDVAVLMTLSFDGRIAWDPIDPIDEAVRIAFCRHQQTDKGFGPALGPDAADFFADGLRAMGHEVRLAPSDWRFGERDGEILDAMIDGIAGAAGEIDPDLPLDGWRRRRKEQSTAGDLALTVGHLDLLALP